MSSTTQMNKTTTKTMNMRHVKKATKTTRCTKTVKSINKTNIYLPNSTFEKIQKIQLIEREILKLEHENRILKASNESKLSKIDDLRLLVSRVGNEQCFNSEEIVNKPPKFKFQISDISTKTNSRFDDTECTDRDDISHIKCANENGSQYESSNDLKHFSVLSYYWKYNLNKISSAQLIDLPLLA